MREHSHHVDASCCQRRKRKANQTVASKIFSDSGYVQFHTLRYASVVPDITYAKRVRYLHRCDRNPLLSVIYPATLLTIPLSDLAVHRFRGVQSHFVYLIEVDATVLIHAEVGKDYGG